MEKFRKKFVRNGCVIGGTWKKNENRKFYAECLGKELVYTHPKDWYQITGQQIIDNNGGSLLKNYDSNK